MERSLRNNSESLKLQVESDAEQWKQQIEQLTHEITSLKKQLYDTIKSKEPLENEIEELKKKLKKKRSDIKSLKEKVAEAKGIFFSSNVTNKF